MSPDWSRRALAALEQDQAAMVTVLATEGSAPRGAGTRMIVTASGMHGTIGGGKLEFVAVEQARAILGLAPGTWRIQDYPLGPLLGQCCGGRVRLLVEHLDPTDMEWLSSLREGDVLVTELSGQRPRRTISGSMGMPASARGPIPGKIQEVIGEMRRPLYLFGAGHVGQAIAQALHPLPFALAWFDSRPEFAQIEGVALAAPELLCERARNAPNEAAILILTHDHGLDYALTADALRGQATFVGLIGSATKRTRFLKRLRTDGIDPIRLTCPIGIEGIKGKAPEVIAIAVAAQMLMLPAVAKDRAADDIDDCVRRAG